MTRRARVAGIDDDTIMRDGLALLLTAHDIVATFPSVTEFLRAAPDVEVVLLDLKLTGTGRVCDPQGQAAVRAVADAGYRVLVYTNERRRAVLAGCLAAGARGVVHKAEPLDTLADAVARIADQDAPYGSMKRVFDAVVSAVVKERTVAVRRRAVDSVRTCSETIMPRSPDRLRSVAAASSGRSSAI